ncbi:hypothetical protein KPH14_008853 [Odynerus spinipes]|uniref:Uncharacterized protein n=1 Tax=Odynerus spinipes TaxID=1348599 RepID=A0AAD9R9U7_9HYME|nr:hypothetical protein KPH14_008853 [Odynerus spinipes]
MKRAERKSFVRKIYRSVNKKPQKSDNLKASETSPVLTISDRNLKKPTISSTSKKTTTGNSKPNTQKSSLSRIPKDAAVHFGNFYGLHENARGRSGDTDQATKYFRNVDLKSSPKSEFTRQMVQKLERSAGTADYARQVSALLEDTVEPANFRVNPLPSENSIPDGKQNPTGYPLWYKDPYKMPITAKKEYQLLKEKYRNMNVDSNIQSETVVEESSTSEDERDDASLDEFEVEEDELEDERSAKESLKNESSDRSSSVDETNDESSVSYESSNDEDGSSIVSSEKEEENDDYETVDTALPVQ